VRVREAIPDDARAVAEVHVVSWRWAYAGMISDEVLQQLSVEDRERVWRESLAAAEPGRCVLVAEADDGTVEGFAAFGPSEDPEAAADSAGEVYAIYVRSEVAGTGVGRELFSQTNDALGRSGFRRATLWVLEANERARRFYEAAGWAWDGTTGTHRFDCANLPVVRYAAELAPAQIAPA
jgi:GNAT superfamily N-acetyltransferase